MNEMPYSLVFYFAVVIPLEIGLPTIQTEAYDDNNNVEILIARNLDLADEQRENALVWMANYQKQLVKIYNQKVQHIEFSVGDLILRKIVGNIKDLVDGKLGPNWEGLYKITKLVGKGAYHLKDLKSKQVLRP